MECDPCIYSICCKLIIPYKKFNRRYLFLDPNSALVCFDIFNGILAAVYVLCGDDFYYSRYISSMCE